MSGTVRFVLNAKLLYLFLVICLIDKTNVENYNKNRGISFQI